MKSVGTTEKRLLRPHYAGRTTRREVIEIFGGCLSVPLFGNVTAPANARGDLRDKFGVHGEH